ncbi:hypothetical protein B0I35DRAFT_484078 [Stachybotrys elegans]|uniref:Uncharacterized protein n=1 Tax=Stachybotrys elegans TaxID=80388 RepID=A0A8K0SDR7_9HYPO|nr:hypothetical protein B0I35DRAFT_484078 [Stachybotrys elegans]
MPSRLFLTDPVTDRAGLETRKGQIVEGTVQRHFSLGQLRYQRARDKEALEVEKCLGELPKGLDDMYAGILSQVEHSRWYMVRNILRWCTFAQRPLELWELAAALEGGTPAPRTLHEIDVREAI